MKLACVSAFLRYGMASPVLKEAANLPVPEKCPISVEEALMRLAQCTALFFLCKEQ